MTTPFDALASSYREQWSDTPRGRRQRAAVWREIDRVFLAGDRVLDLGCGVGDDALHLAALGVDVMGIDASAQMVEIARGRGVDALVLKIEDLCDAAFGPRSFSGAISNFGALNCVADLHPVAAQLAMLIRPHCPVAICLMGRLCWTDPRHALQRLRGHTRWRGLDIYYPTARKIRAAFAPWFALKRRVAIGHGDHQLYVFRRSSEC